MPKKNLKRNNIARGKTESRHWRPLPLSFQFIFIFLNFIQATPIAFFVSPAGNDEATGTKAAPFATLERARTEVRMLRKSSKITDTVTIYLRLGRYFRTNTFVLTEEDSGLPGSPTVWRSYEGENARIIGGQAIPFSLFEPVADEVILNRIINQKVRKKLLKCDLSRLGITDFGEVREQGATDFDRHYDIAPLEVFFDGKPMHLSRWPNYSAQPQTIDNYVSKQGYSPAAKLGPNDSWFPFAKQNIIFSNGFPFNFKQFILPGDAGERARHWGQAEEFGIRGGIIRGYAQNIRKMRVIDPEQGLCELKTPARLWKSYNQSTINHFFVFDLIEELDVPGEYFLDRKTGTLFLYPPSKLKPDSEVLVSLLNEVIVSLEGCSNVLLSDLTFEVTRSSAIYMEGGQDNLIANSTIRNTGLVGVQLGRGVAEGGELIPRVPLFYRSLLTVGNGKIRNEQGTAVNRLSGRRNGIFNCVITETGQGGVLLGGGDRKTLTPGANFVDNCVINNVNRWLSLYSEQIVIDGVGNRVSHNDLGGNGGGIIYFYGNDHIIEYNEIYKGSQHTLDGGAVESRQNPSMLGNILRYNYLHNNGRFEGNPFVMTVYLDNSTCGVTLFGNLFVSNATRLTPPLGVIAINGGHRHKIYNNIFVDNLGQGIEDGYTFERTHRTFLERAHYLTNHVNVFGSLYREKYPEFYEMANSILNKETNVELFNYVSSNVQINAPGAFGVSRYKDKNYRTANWELRGVDSVGFYNFAEGNFSLRNDSEVYRKIPGFHRIPVEKIGRLSPEKNIRPNLHNVHNVDNISFDEVLRWAPALRATSHTLYLSTSRREVKNGEAVALRGRPVTSEWEIPKGTLKPNETYFWRVDAEIDNQVFQGDVWHFRTTRKTR